MEPAFEAAVRELLAELATGGEGRVEEGGALARVLREADPTGPRAAVAVLADRWLRAAPVGAAASPEMPLLNRPDLGEPEKLHAVLREHVVGQRRWQELSSNESTFYRYRRAAMLQLAERLWTEIRSRPLATNRPRPEYVEFVGRRAELERLLRLLADERAGGAIVGVEGPGGSGKTALLHAVADTCEAAGRCWQPVPLEGGRDSVPLFDAIVWVSPAGGGGLADLLDTVARTLDYPGLLARAVEDRRQAVRDLLARRATLLIVDDLDRTAPEVVSFLLELPGASRALVAARRRLPPEVRAVTPAPLTAEEVRQLVLAEAGRQGAADAGIALVASQPGREEDAQPLLVAARYPLLAGWAVGQLRRGQTVERVRERLAHAEGEVFEEMFAASVVDLSAGAETLLWVLAHVLPMPADRATLLAARGTEIEAAVALDELLETSLLEVSGAGYSDALRRYGLHEVTRSFVRARLPRDSQEARAAVARLAQHYAELAEEVGGPARNWRTFGRLEAELPNIMAVVEASSAYAAQAARGGSDDGAPFDQALLQLAHGMRNVFWFGRAWAEGLALFHRAIEAARRLEDARAEGWNTYRLGALHYELGTGGFAESARRAREAAGLLKTAGDRRGEGHALRLLGRASRSRGQAAEAERLLAEAETLLAEYGHGDDLAIARASRADLLRLTGRLDEAAALYEQVLASGLDDPGTEANVYCDLGEVALARREPVAVAEARFARAEQLAEAAGARAIVARSRLGEALAARERGADERARQLAVVAADLFDRLGDGERAHEARRLA